MFLCNSVSPSICLAGETLACQIKLIIFCQRHSPCMLLGVRHCLRAPHSLFLRRWPPQSPLCQLRYFRVVTLPRTGTRSLSQFDGTLTPLCQTPSSIPSHRPIAFTTMPATSRRQRGKPKAKAKTGSKLQKRKISDVAQVGFDLLVCVAVRASMCCGTAVCCNRNGLQSGACCESQ